MREINLSERSNKDVLQVIFSFLTPQELARAAQVCRFWNEQANVFNIRASQNERAFFPWLVGNLERSFLKMSLFLKKSELKKFLLSSELSLGLKILVLDNLRRPIPENMPLPFPKAHRAQFFAWEFFQASLQMRNRKDALVQKSLSQYIDNLLLQLLRAYRVFNNVMREDIRPKLAEEHPHLILSISPELEKLLGEQKNIGLSLRDSFYQLEGVSNKFILQKTGDKTRLNFYYRLLYLMVGVASTVIVSNSVSFFPEGKYRYFPAIFLTLVILKSITAFNDHYSDKKEKVKSLLNDVRLDEDPEDDNNPRINGPNL